METTKNYFIDLDGTRHRLLAIEYSEGRPHEVVTEEFWDHSQKPWFQKGKHQETGTCPKYYDFNWSERDGRLYWHNSGMGGDKRTHALGQLINWRAEIWIAPDIELTKHVERAGELIEEKATSEEIERLGYTVLDAPRKIEQDGECSVDPFEFADGDTETIWCAICQDNLPEESACDHLFWSKSNDQWIGPGCAYEDCIPAIRESVFAVLDKSKLSDVIERAITENKFNLKWSGTTFGYDDVYFYFDGKRYGDEFTDDLTEDEEDSMSDGMQWLSALDDKTIDAKKLTLEWIAGHKRKSS